MEDDVIVESLPSTAEKSDPGMKGSMSQSEHIALLEKLELAKVAGKAAPKVEDGDETQTDADEAAEAADESTDAADGDKSADDEQSEDKPEAEGEPVLSKLDPKTQEKIQKRIGKEVSKTKTERARAELAEAKIAELEEKLNATPEPDIQPAASISDAADKTSTAKSDADLAKLEQDARNTVEFVEMHEKAIMKAIATDQETVTIAGQEFNVDQLRGFSKSAAKHLASYIPQRREFLKEQATLVGKAKAVLPAMFEKGTTDNQEYVTWQRKNPAARNLAGSELLYALAKVGEKHLADKAGKKPAATKAASTPPKTGADTGAASAAAKPRGNATGEKARLTVELAQAQKRFERSRSQDDYKQTLILQSQLKKL